MSTHPASTAGGPPARAAAAFAHRFGQRPSHWVRAPARVNLIGEHTDYNDGFVLPMAIAPAVWIAFGQGHPDRLLLHSLEFEGQVDLPLAELLHGPPPWAEYARGIVWAMRRSGLPLVGWRGVVASDIPTGAGLSSSAAFELALARGFTQAAELPWDPQAMAHLARTAEVEWVGVHCGIMDQMVCACAQGGHALLLDCRSLEMQTLPLPPGAAVAVLDTGTRRGLVDSPYNERRGQCEAAARSLGRAALRDVSLAELEAHGPALEPVLLRRARHVVSENERTRQAARALADGDAVEFGRLMDASHASLAGDYEVSSEALDRIVEIARRHSGCYGARMTGAGFAGCAVALVDAAADDFAARVERDFRQATGLTATVFLTPATSGVELFPA